MPGSKSGRKTKTKGTSTNMNKANAQSDVTTSETDSGWKSPGKLKQEVQTIIDIMGPPLSPKFNYNTSSEADNEESVFTNSKLSLEKLKEYCHCNEVSEKTDTLDVPSKDETNISTAADLNTTTISATMEDLTDPKVNFPYVEDFCRNPQYICPPPLVPANVCLNSECVCPQLASILHGKHMHQNYPVNDYQRETVQPKNYDVELNSNVNKTIKVNKDPKNAFITWLKAMVSSSKSLDVECNNVNSEYYKMNVKKNRGREDSPPRRVVFELVEGGPKNLENCNSICNPVDVADTVKTKKNVKNERLQTRADMQCFCINDSISESRKARKPVEKTTYSDSSGKTRVDVYYFDHGSFNHYQTTDAPPLVTTEEVAEKTEKHTTRFWAELFGTIHIGFSFATSFILQLFRFLLYSICRPLTIGLIQLGSDYFFKPLLVTLFNGIIQPVLIFIYNVVASIRDICDPIAEGMGYFLRELAVLVRSFRLVEVSKENCRCKGDCTCEKKKKSKILC